MPTSRWLSAIWFCFFVRALFYCAALPIWEGYDEWSHFAVVQRMAFRGEILVARDRPVPRDVAASLGLAPVSWECRTLGLAYDDFWKLPALERGRRATEFRTLPSAREDSTGAFKTYEGLQGPLSYWMMAPLLWVFGGAHLATQALVLRWFNAAILSFMIPLTFLTARTVFRRERVALGCAALLAVMPGLLIGIARVSNESLAVTLFSALVWLSVGELSRRRVMAIGVVLGLGLLTKAYFLTALPVVAAVLVWRCRRVWALWAPGLACAISGWWYARNLVTTGTLTGMWESAVQQSGGVSLGAVPWLRTVDSILFSHLWLGAWSTLTVRSWMYHALYAVMAAATVGLVVQVVLVGRPILAAARFQRAIRAKLGPGVRPIAEPLLCWWGGLQSAHRLQSVHRSEAPTTRAKLGLLILAAYYALFWAGQLWHAALLQTVWGIATSLGCYLNAVGGAEAILCVAGVRALAPTALRSFVVAIGVFLMAVFDFYTLHMVALPYYAGYTAHRAGGGAVVAFHPAGVSVAEFVGRLALFKSPLLPAGVLVALWLAYMAATFALVAISVRLAHET